MDILENKIFNFTYRETQNLQNCRINKHSKIIHLNICIV